MKILILLFALKLPNPPVVEWTLPNGLRVAYQRVGRMPIVAVQLWYHVGAKDEPSGRRGSAHMFEHVMFKGSEHVPPEEHARLVDRLGGRANAFTGDDVTSFQQVVPKAYVDFAVLLEAERMRRLLFRKSMVATEKEVVKEEFRLRFENDPIEAAVLRLRSLAFTRHPYRYGPGGAIEDLDRTSADDLKKFYDAYYQPNNALLVVVGDVAEEEVRAAAEKHFGAIPRGADPPRPAGDLAEPKQAELRRETQKPAQIGIVIGGWKIPGARSPDLIPLKVAMSILSDGDSSRLHQRAVRKDKVGLGAGAALMEAEDPGLLLVYGVHLAADQADKLEAALIDEAERLGREKVDARVLEKAKNQIASRLAFALGNVEAVAQQIGESALLRGDAGAWMNDLEAIAKVTADDVQRVARSVFVKEGLTVVRVPPGAAP
jgi:zinc protease